MKEEEEVFFTVHHEPSGSGGRFETLEEAEKHAETEALRTRESQWILQTVSITQIGQIETKRIELKKVKKQQEPPDA